MRNINRWQGSSAGESARLIPVRSRVRISPLLNKKTGLVPVFLFGFGILMRTHYEFERERAEGGGWVGFAEAKTSRAVDPLNASEQDNLSLAK